MQISKFKRVHGRRSRQVGRPPYIGVYKFIPGNGSPNRLLEIYTPREALEIVTSEHRRMADWIKGQPWEHARPTSDQWRFIQVSKRLKSCRNQLMNFVEELDALVGGGGTHAPTAADDIVRQDCEPTEAELAAEAQREADLLDIMMGL